MTSSTWPPRTRPGPAEGFWGSLTGSACRTGHRSCILMAAGMRACLHAGYQRRCLPGGQENDQIPVVWPCRAWSCARPSPGAPWRGQERCRRPRGPGTARTHIAVVGQAGAEEMNQERLRRVAGYRHGCSSWCRLLRIDEGNQRPDALHGHPAAAPLTAMTLLLPTRRAGGAGKRTAAQQLERSAAADGSSNGYFRAWRMQRVMAA